MAQPRHAMGSGGDDKQKSPKSAAGQKSNRRRDAIHSFRLQRFDRLANERQRNELLVLRRVAAGEVQ